ncbi:MAG: hypothetical protein JWM11_214 [Planctomycetaceae bacterium]|nr:hypothetical protein [Planctomycetaceae bacterium]
MSCAVGELSGFGAVPHPQLGLKQQFMFVILGALSPSFKNEAASMSQSSVNQQALQCFYLVHWLLFRTPVRTTKASR